MSLRNALVSGAAAALLLPPVALADETQVETIVVTANKRDESIQNVPIAMSALTGAQLEQTNAVRFEDYAATIPSLSYTSERPGETQVTLRGITSGVNQPNATVATYVDDVPFGSTNSDAAGSLLTPDFDTFDLSRIEVLEGPQGTLYGASSLGGVIKYVTNAPELNNFDGKAQLDFGSNESGGIGYGGKVMLNVPIVDDQLAIRTVLFRREDGGFIDDVGVGGRNINKDDFTGGRVELLFQPRPDFSVRLNVFIQDIQSDGASTVDVDPKTLQPVYGDLKENRLFQESFEERYNLYNAVVNWDLGFATLTSSSAYSTFKEDSTADLSELYGQFGPAFGVPQNQFAVNETEPTSVDRWTEELRLASPQNHDLEWQLGAYVDGQRTMQNQNIFGYALPQRSLVSELASAQLPASYFEYAFFGDVDYYLTSDIDVQAGLRWSRNDQHFTLGAEGPLVGGNDSSPPAGSTESDTTFAVSPRWHITLDAMVYARIASGYRPGGPNAIPPGGQGVVPPIQQSDTVQSYEVGAKTEWLDHRLVVDVSAYHVDWDDVQLTSTAGGFAFGGNGGAALSQGVELHTVYKPAQVQGLTLGFNGSYTDAYLTKGAPDVGGQTGDALPTVPRWGGSATVDYTMPLSNDLDGVIGGSFRYVDSRMSDFGLQAGRVKIPSYNVFDLRLGVEDDTVSAMLFVKNLFDERGISTIMDALAPPGSTSPYQATVIQPRTIGLSIIKQF
jgi:outer membrane receptor protein involved in Fe transport